MNIPAPPRLPRSTWWLAVLLSALFAVLLYPSLAQSQSPDAPTLSVSDDGLAAWSYTLPDGATFTYSEVRWKPYDSSEDLNDWSDRSSPVFYSPEAGKYQIPDLTSGTEYKAKALVSVSQGGSDVYLKSNVVVFPQRPPPSPTGLTATGGDGSVILRWKDPGDDAITGYEYQYRAASDADWGSWMAVPKSGQDTVGYKLAGLTNGAEYRFRLRAVNGGGASSSAPAGEPGYVAATPKPPPPPKPAVPTGLTATAGDGSVTLTWDNPGDATITGYEYQSRQAPPGSDWGERQVGALVGRNAGDIHAVYAMGDVTASDNLNTSSDGTDAGGLVGQVLSGGTLRAGYATGDVSIYPGATGGARNPESDEYGKAVGTSAGTINDVYGSGANSSHASTPTGVTNKTDTELKTPTTYGTGSSIYANWNLNLDGVTGSDDPWNFGTNSEFPTIKYNSPAESHPQQQPATFTLAASPATIYESTLGGSTRATSSTITATLSAAKTYDIGITLPAPKDGAYTYATGDSHIFTIPRNTTTKTLTINAVNNQKCGTGVCGVTSNANVVQTLTPTATAT